jgi:hypothetical protein
MSENRRFEDWSRPVRLLDDDEHEHLIPLNPLTEGDRIWSYVTAALIVAAILAGIALHFTKRGDCDPCATTTQPKD